MKKLKIFFNYDKEEQWLAQMAAEGYLFTGKTVFGRFKFEKSEGGAAKVYKIDYRYFKREEDFQDYITLFADSGWNHVYGSKFTGTQYFVQGDKTAGADIFSDTASKAGRYKRLSRAFSLMCAVYIPLIISSVLNGSVYLEALFNPSKLYYTPGLWDMSGTEFWRAFLFETPFALGRGFSWLICILFLCFWVYCGAKARNLYKAALEKDSVG